MKTLKSCVLSSLTYGDQTWAVTDTQAKRIAITQHRMLRSMLGIKLKDKIKKFRNKEKSKSKKYQIGYQQTQIQ